ncbi:MAG: hypothetical protein Harvfovirus5_44 [Harvfovirus sp.]|uniref:Uncharacterized protein n=1 Tax=Harvfovirus sp. TaxID=2487768 RepID=A0A3G5A0T2_9VIRU|nr:MAG: hypothetical protein Harvfovirus5_44 [Harvfovirus sp.]
MTSVSLGGFRNSGDQFFPLYTRPCWSCSEPLKPERNIILMKDLFNKTAHNISKTQEKPKFEWSCECKQEYKNDHLWERKYSRYSECCCGLNRANILKLFWVCPFCLRVICGRQCFYFHMNTVHISFGEISAKFAVDPKLIGAFWCGLCHDIFERRNPDFTILPDNITAKELLMEAIKCERRPRIIDEMDSVPGSIIPEEITPKVDFTQFCIKSKACAKCENWDEKKIKLPKELGELPPVYPHETIIPSQFQTEYIHIGMIFSDFKKIKQNSDIYSKFIPDLLRRSYFEKVSFFVENSNVYNRVINNYVADLWFDMLYVKGILGKMRLRTPEEVQRRKIPTEPILAAVRGEISVINGELTCTGLPNVLYPIIYSYLPWQLWNFERVFSQIHSDLIRLGPSIVALLSKKN